MNASIRAQIIITRISTTQNQIRTETISQIKGPLKKINMSIIDCLLIKNDNPMIETNKKIIKNKADLINFFKELYS